ncbi:hypothetical protein IQ244_09830 [Nostoc sp. LEGE 06077]|uniref:hypothetical protein n=1 Tax=Nostoc sp. LEGE 06077 TaxID=915325 RepID=UPI001881DA3E|nr:hypothetical protein [Nostoc sp. LEGE 06077]MBE9206809.1 hypothetical protein [Nostoc sp. LEGE 06077]
MLSTVASRITTRLEVVVVAEVLAVVKVLAVDAVVVAKIECDIILTRVKKARCIKKPLPKFFTFNIS